MYRKLLGHFDIVLPSGPSHTAYINMIPVGRTIQEANITTRKMTVVYRA